jgi:hypothetical protein
METLHKSIHLPSTSHSTSVLAAMKTSPVIFAVWQDLILFNPQVFILFLLGSDAILHRIM